MSEILDNRIIREREIAWYQKHGRYPERVKHGRLFYVIGDFSWNWQNPDKTEYIEQAMRNAGVYKPV